MALESAHAVVAAELFWTFNAVAPRQPHFEHVHRPSLSRAASTRYPQRVQFAPSSSAAKGSAKRRVVAFEWLDAALCCTWCPMVGMLLDTATGSSSVKAGFCGDGSHAGMTCTTGGAGLGVIGCVFGITEGEADFA